MSTFLVLGFAKLHMLTLKAKEVTLVTLKVYDVLGNEIKTLVKTELSSGFYEVDWNGDDDYGATVPAGVYLYQLSAAGQTETKRMLFLK